MHDMYEQPKYLPGAPSSLFFDGSSARTPPAGSVPERSVDSEQPPTNLQLLERGRGRYNIYCAPCHGEGGHGDGMVVQRGFPAPPTYHSNALRKAPDSLLYDVITNGYGVMYPYADRLTPGDRWAIVAYIRALQLSQSAPRSRLDDQDLRQLDSR
jgi:mono/diheme cytochrome c family protein